MKRKAVDEDNIRTKGGLRKALRRELSGCVRRTGKIDISAKVISAKEKPHLLHGETWYYPTNK